MSLINVADTLDTHFNEIPIINLKNLKSHDPTERRRLANEVRNACIQVGFFYVINHGIPEHMTEGVLEMAKRFFSLPVEIKMEIDHHKTPNFKGYSQTLSRKDAGDLRAEGFSIGWEDLNIDNDDDHDGVMAGANVWPSEEHVPRFHQTVLDYYYSAVNLGKALFPIFALALNLPEHFFDDKTQHSAAAMNILHYPPQTGPADEQTVGFSAHTDWECFTILWQQPGIQALQVLNPEKQWVNAAPIPGSLVINLGDQFARWTNDIFKATVHRTMKCNAVHRYSIPLFFGTDYNVKLEPIPSCISSDCPPRYEVVTAGEYVKGRYQAFYGH